MATTLDESRAKQAGAPRAKRVIGRLRHAREIREVLRFGRSYSGESGVARVRPGPGPLHRLCVVTSRRVGKAHDRNLVRRRVREILRHEMATGGEPVDIVFRARPRAAEIDFGALRESLTSLLERARLRGAPDPMLWR